MPETDPYRAPAQDFPAKPRRRGGWFVHAGTWRRAGGSLLLCAVVASVWPRIVYAGDILRGGATAGSARKNTEARQNAGAEAASLAKAKAQDRLARTTKAINDMRQLQAAARAAAGDGGVPDGLVPGGLERLAGGTWTGANAPVQSGNAVNITQTKQQALLDWKTFNVGKNTSLNFDQTAGGADSGKWIAFNKVFDPSGKPSQIRGQISADGQVYIINQNGIIFGAGSQVNARTLVASSIPINDNLIANGLLNHAKNSAEFLFSAAASTSSVIVEPGATITATTSAEGSGGRVILAGATVLNEGTISTPSGQTILAAGLQIGFDVHSKAYPVIPDRKTDSGSEDDPSLRGLDAYVGNVGDTGGSVTNSGLVEIPTGNLIMVGKQVSQLGVVESSTSVTLNGRIDLLANYNAVANTTYDPDIKGQLAFLNRSTGTVRLGDNSATRILPDYSSQSTTVGTKLPIKSQVNIQGELINMGKDAMLQVPNGDVAISAGQWRPIAQQTNDKFAYTAGQFFMDSGSFVDVSGSPDVFVPLANRILTVQLRGNELSLSPLQRTGEIRGDDLVIDTRRTGSYNGQYWVGTPLGDATGFVDIIQKTAAQLTADGGSVTIQAGESFVAQRGSVIDVSGGYYKHEGGKIHTTRLRQGARIVNISEAYPDQVYDGIYTATSTEKHSKWGVTKTYSSPLAPTGGYSEASYVEGANGGKLNITAPAMVLDGEMLGATVIGPRQLRSNTSSSSSIPSSSLPTGASLKLTFEGTKEVQSGEPKFFAVSPTPPKILFGSSQQFAPVSAPQGNSAASLPADRLQTVALPADFFSKSGFSSVEIVNKHGDFEVPAGVNIDLPEGSKLIVKGKNIRLQSSIRAPGGTLDFTAYNMSPYQIPIDLETTPLMPQPEIDTAAGSITVGAATRLDVAGLIIDDRQTATSGANSRAVATNGGEIRLVGYNVNLQAGSQLDVSGGVAVNPIGKYAYGNAGSITIEAGQDVTYPSVLGGKLTFLADLRGYAGKDAKGGALSIKAPLIQIGGAALHSDTLLLTPDFFNRGGFQKFNLTGIGMALTAITPTDPEAPAPYLPAVLVTSGTTIQPVVESFAYVPYPGDGQSHLKTMLRPLGERPVASISLLSSTVTNSFRDPVTTAGQGEKIVIRGDIVLSETAQIITEPGGSVTLSGSTVTVLGGIQAPGGEITIQGANSFPLDKLVKDNATYARPTVHIGPKASISAAGAAVMLPDAFGRRNPKVYSGGKISVAGNIVAESGALLDVSGTSAVKDVHPSEIGLLADSKVPVNSGLNTKPYALRTTPYQIDSNGGSITLAGHEMLLSDATLLGRAGGPTAIGGTLAVSSGRFYQSGSNQYGSDINLVVTQSDPTLSASSAVGIGRPVRGADGKIVSGMGFFAADKFLQGGFDSLDLGFNTKAGAGKARGGNVEFRGSVTINAPGSLRLASGGVIRADSNVLLSASYLAVGQPFAATLTPAELENYEPFVKEDAVPGTQEFVPPTSGSGRITFNAGLIDVGNLVFKNTSKAEFSAPGGDIRGVGTVNIRGDLTLTAAQIYPASLADFNIFAYDPAGGTGSVSIVQSGKTHAPLSAGGSLSIQASVINQGGTLLAPFGSIVLGWDGVTDQKPSTAALDAPENNVVGTSLTSPIARRITLASGSLTSVSGIDYSSGEALMIPFGLSADGLTIIDPRGIDVTSSGLRAKTISIAGESVVTQAGSTIDIRGGGDLFAYRWVNGTGGTIDFLGSASTDWASGSGYEAGDLVFYKKPGETTSKTYSARVKMDPNDYDGAVPTPGINRYWSEVQESYAVAPGYHSSFAPYAAFNTSTQAKALGGDPGYVSSTLKIGDRITVDAGSGLQAGSYTLLPRRYALLPGAYLVTPQSGKKLRGLTKPEGAELITGYKSNSFSLPSRQSAIRSLYEVVSPEVLAGRARYEVYDLSSFIANAATRNDLTSVQYLPRDSGYLSLHGNSGLALDGSVLSQAGRNGRGARIDISSFADMTIVGSGQSAGGGVVLDAAKLSEYGAESLLIGGQRTFSADSTTVDVRTRNIMVSNSGTPLQGSEITLVSKETLSLAPGSSIVATGSKTETGRLLSISGDGVFVQASADSSSRVERTGTTASTLPRLTIGAGARVSGSSISLDSSYGFALDPNADLQADTFTFGAGQISILLNGPTALTGQIDPLNPQLVLSGATLNNVQQARVLNLLSYRNTIDIYGPGSFGAPTLESLSLQAGAVRGFNQGAASSTVTAGKILLSNSRNVAAPAAGASGGSLVFNAGSVAIGSGSLEINGYADVIFNATGGILFEDEGGLSVQNNLTANTPVLTVAQGARQNFVARVGALDLNKTGTSAVAGGLGGELTFKGTSARIFSDILVPSGTLKVETDGNIVIGGVLNAQGTSKTFYDVVRYTDGGEIRLTSKTGNIRLEASSNVSVAANAGGGNAGAVVISAGGGQFSALGKFDGFSGAGGDGGSFTLDAGTLSSLDTLRDLLNSGGFSESRNIRVRAGDLFVRGTIAAGNSWAAKNISFSADAGSLTVLGDIDASGTFGGSIALTARDDVTVQSGAILTVAAQKFSSAGKGGEIRIEAGAQSNGSVNTVANAALITAAQPLLDLQAGSIIDLSVAEFKIGDQIKGNLALELAEPNGRYTDPTSSAFLGQFQGTLHLRAPQILDGSGLLIDPIDSTIRGASSIQVEGYRLYDLTSSGGIITSALKDKIKTDGNTFVGTSGSNSPTYATMHNAILANNAALDPIVVFMPGAEIINQAVASSLNYSFNTAGSTITVIPESGNGGGVTFTNGTPGNNLIRTDIAAIVTSASGVITNLAANTPTSLAAGSTVSFASEGKITFLSGSGGAMPVTLAAGASYTQSSTGASGSVSAAGSVISLRTAGSSSISLAAGTRVTLPNGTTGTNTTNRIRSNVAGTITSPTGTVAVLAANVNTQVAEGSTIALNAAGTLSFATGTGGPILVALTSGSFTTSGATGLTPASGDIVLGATNQKGANSDGTALSNDQLTAGDWDLSTFRFGAKSAPGVLTLRAKGDIVFNNTLSDGFSPVVATSDNGWSRMWLAPLASLNAALPLNTQSWSYRITAGADLSSADPASVLSASNLAAGKGSVLVGEYYPAVLNSFTTGSAAGSDTLGQTADNIRFVNTQSDTTNRGTRYEVVRTGTGDISVNAGRDVKLRNQFATIYTAGVGLPDRTRIFEANDFVVPTITRTGLGLSASSTDGNLGILQQPYGVWYAMAGGDITIQARGNIGRYTVFNGSVVADTSRQIPTNWLYRRGYVDETGNFGVSGPIAGNGLPGSGTVNDTAASTTWWIDYSNFFQGIGALGGGDISMVAGSDIINADAVIPTNARMAGRDPGTGQNIAPDTNNLLELGGGDLVVRAGNNISGGSYYVERGTGTLFAGRDLTTNSARTISKGILDGSSPLDALTWMPTTVYVGNSHFDIAARGNVLLGPITNPFLLPQGMNNRFWYKTQFNTFSADSGATVSSYGGDITHRLNVTLPGDQKASPLLYYWVKNQNVLTADSAAKMQPWLRLTENSVENYQTMFGVSAPNLKSTAFGGNINIVGNLTLYPSATGTLELLASAGLPGIQKTGPTIDRTGVAVEAWTSATINLSDARLSSLPGIASPLAFQKVANSRVEAKLLDNSNLIDPLASVRPGFVETGAIEGADAAVSKQNALHDSGILHARDTQPLRLYAMGGDITGITLYSPKQSLIVASKDINDIAFYLQNANEQSVSVVSAGRDIILFNENSPLRAIAADEDRGNLLVDDFFETSTGAFTQALAGDIQISGQGTLEVLAARNIDLGSGANFRFGGLGKGITSIGRQRNPFLPFEGAHLVVLSGINASGGGPALGLRGSTLDFDRFISKYITGGGIRSGVVSESLEKDLAKFTSLSSEQQAIVALDVFFSELAVGAKEGALTGSYDAGFAAVDSLFKTTESTAATATETSYGWFPWESSQQTGSSGQIFTRVRDIRTTSGGAITLAAPKGGITMAPSIFGNPLTPPGIVTEFGGAVSIFMNGSLSIGQARVFTLRGGDITIWSSTGDIAAGAAAKTVVTAPPTRVTIDRPSAQVATDLGGLATGGGIGVLASVEGVEAGVVYLGAPNGTVDAGDAGIRATGDIIIGAATVLNADNIAAGGISTGVPTAPVVAAPNIGGLTSGSSTAAATSTAANQVTQQARPQAQEESPSTITVEVLGYGGDDQE